MLYLSAYFEQHRSRYYELLMNTSRTGDFAAWISYFLGGVAAQAAEAEERTVRLVELQASMRNDLLSERASTNIVRTAELLFSTPYISSNWLASALDVTYPTAQSAINTLVSRGDLVEATGRKRNRFYFAARIFEAVYGQSPAPASTAGDR